MSSCPRSRGCGPYPPTVTAELSSIRLNLMRGGYLFVSTQGLGRLAGDHDDWVGTEMTSDDDFYWLVVDVGPGSRYKFTDGETWLADPWSRAYAWDSEGEMSMVVPYAAHLERHFQVSDSEMQAIWEVAISETRALIAEGRA